MSARADDVPSASPALVGRSTTFSAQMRKVRASADGQVGQLQVVLKKHKHKPSDHKGNTCSM